MINPRLEQLPVKSDELIIHKGTLLEIYSNPDGVYGSHIADNGHSVFTEITTDMTFAELIIKTQDLGRLSDETITFIKIIDTNSSEAQIAKANPFQEESKDSRFVWISIDEWSHDES